MRRLIFLALWVAGSLLSTGCSTYTARLNVNFEADTIEAAPALLPPPNPPADSIQISQNSPITSLVVASPSGGRSLRVKPDVDLGVDRRRVLVATSEPLTTNPPAYLRGHFRVSVSGSGEVRVGLGDGNTFACGFLIHSGVEKFISLLSPFLRSQVELPPPAYNPSPTPGVTMAGFPGNNVIDINWSIDQVTGTCAASVPGGQTQNRSFSAAPMPQLTYVIWLEKAAPFLGTVVILDNLFAEERQ